jgi:hypothetical protein
MNCANFTNLFSRQRTQRTQKKTEIPNSSRKRGGGNFVIHHSDFISHLRLKIHGIRVNSFFAALNPAPEARNLCSPRSIMGGQILSACPRLQTPSRHHSWLPLARLHHPHVAIALS